MKQDPFWIGQAIGISKELQTDAFTRISYVGQWGTVKWKVKNNLERKPYPHLSIWRAVACFVFDRTGYSQVLFDSE